MGSGLPYLLLELVAEVAVVAYVPEILEQRGGGKEKKDQQERAAARVGVAAHLPEADRNDERSQRGQDRQGRKMVAVDPALQGEPGRRTRRQQREKSGDEDEIALRRP